METLETKINYQEKNEGLRKQYIPIWNELFKRCFLLYYKQENEFKDLNKNRFLEENEFNNKIELIYQDLKNNIFNSDTLENINTAGIVTHIMKKTQSHLLSEELEDKIKDVSEKINPRKIKREYRNKQTQKIYSILKKILYNLEEGTSKYLIKYLDEIEYSKQKKIKIPPYYVQIEKIIKIYKPLIELTKEAEKIRNELFRLNQGVVRYYSKLKEIQKIEDIRQYNYYNALIATITYNPHLGAYYSFLNAHLRHKYNNFFYQEKLIKISSHVIDNLKRVNKRIQKIIEKEKKEINLEDLLKSKKISKKEYQVLNETKISFIYIDQEIMNESVKSSIDEKREYGNNYSNKDTTIINCEHYLLKRAICTILKTIDKKDAEIIKLRFGINKDKEHTLQEIANMYHVTRERIRQIEERALKELSKNNLLIQINESFLND